MLSLRIFFEPIKERFRMLLHTQESLRSNPGRCSSASGLRDVHLAASVIADFQLRYGH